MRKDWSQRECSGLSHVFFPETGSVVLASLAGGPDEEDAAGDFVVLWGGLPALAVGSSPEATSG